MGFGAIIGETTHIGDNVKLYQGVTLAHSGSRGTRGRGDPRHQAPPHRDDDVMIYAGATILGGNTVIGKGFVIGGSVWLTSSVPPGAAHDLSERPAPNRDARRSPFFFFNVTLAPA